ncbi:MAG: pectate lyase [Firmicutes bacterium]|nr:pectate lyase [Bacillota bacterium]
MFRKKQGNFNRLRWSCLIILTILIFSGVFSEAAVNMLVEDNFNSLPVGSKPPGYEIEETAGSVEIAELPEPYYKAVYLFDPGTSNIRIIKRFKPYSKTKRNSGILVVEVSFMQPDLGSTAKVIRITDTECLKDPDKANAAVHVETRSGAKLAYRTSDGKFVNFDSYEKNKWYRFRIVTDLENQVANIYVNGVLRAEKIPFLKPVKEIGAIDSYTPGSSSKGHYLDNIQVYEADKSYMEDPGIFETEEEPAAQSAAQPVKIASGESDLIEDLTLYDTERSRYWSVRTNIQVNEQMFGDRYYLIASMPDKYAGYDWIRTGCDSKRFSGKVMATFKVKEDATVYIAHDDRIVVKPAWMADWKDTGDDLTDNQTSPKVTYSIFEKSFPANSVVTLGENGGSAGATQYIVIVKGQKGPKAPAKPLTAPAVTVPITWKACLGQLPEWYSSKEAIRIADNVLFYQRDTGGWFKDIDMAQELTEKNKAVLLVEKKNLNDSTIDNDATTDQIKYLAKVYNATKIERFKEGCLKGIDFLLKAQYPNGGWPQYYPKGNLEYHMRITYNDEAMVRVMELLREIGGTNPEYAFVDKDRKAKANQAVAKGIDCILKSQIRVNGKLTAWCAQHDQNTLAPAAARSYELPSISGQESVGIIRFLMSIDKPSPEIIAAVEAAVAWLESVKITGIKVIDKPDPSLPDGFDRVVIADPAAPPIWARFYEIGTNKPFFCGRDGVKKYSLAEIEHERRINYQWYTNRPAILLAKEYPEWRAKWVKK